MNKEQLMQVDKAIDDIGLENIKNIVLVKNVATNGDIIKTIFPNVECREDILGNVFVISSAQLGYIAFRENWWNAPYNADSEDVE